MGLGAWIDAASHSRHHILASDHRTSEEILISRPLVEGVDLDPAMFVVREREVASIVQERLIFHAALSTPRCVCGRPTPSGPSAASVSTPRPSVPGFRTRILERSELGELIGSAVFHGGLWVPDSATVNPAKLQFGLAARARAAGAGARNY